MRSQEEIKYLLNEIQDKLEALENEYSNRKALLFARAEEIRKEGKNEVMK